MSHSLYGRLSLHLPGSQSTGQNAGIKCALTVIQRGFQIQWTMDSSWQYRALMMEHGTLPWGGCAGCGQKSVKAESYSVSMFFSVLMDDGQFMTMSWNCDGTGMLSWGGCTDCGEKNVETECTIKGEWYFGWLVYNHFEPALIFDWEPFIRWR